jgi:hypothetical protein
MGSGHGEPSRGDSLASGAAHASLDSAKETRGLSIKEDSNRVPWGEVSLESWV